MKTVFYSICGDSHWQGCRGDEFVESFKNFHPDIPLIVYREREIKDHFGKNPKLNFYNSKASFAKLLYNHYDLVVNCDADHIFLGRADEILKGDYDVACPANYNVMANASIKEPKGDLVSEKEYFQGGLIASTSKSFWDAYDYAAVKHSAKFLHSENDILNLILTLSDYKVKYLEGNGDFRHPDFNCYYGCSSLGREKDIRVVDNQLMLDGKPVKAYHFSWGGKIKRHPRDLFTKEVTDYIYSTIVHDSSQTNQRKHH